MKSGNCPKCGSARIMCGVEIIDRNGEYQDLRLTARIARRPGALMFKDAEHARLVADICGECGHAELRADQPERLWQAYAAAQQD